MRSYRAPNGRIIPRGAGGRFRRSSLADFGIGRDQLQEGAAVCAGCGYGEDGTWYPILKTGYCPRCGSQEKRP